MPSVVLLSPPSAGKGTISKLLTQDYGYIHLSTGDLLRSVAKSDPLLSERLAQGLYASDEQINEIIYTKISEIINQEEFFILDGYPRNIDQVKFLELIISELNLDDIVYIHLDLDKKSLLDRILNRLTCSGCGRTYNLKFTELSPKIANTCDICSEQLYLRSDDNYESFNQRFDIYLSTLKPVIDYYNRLGVLKYVRVQEDIKDTYKLVLKAIGEKVD